MTSDLGITFENSYAQSLEGLYVPWQGEELPSPSFIKFNESLSMQLGLQPSLLNTPQGASILSGSEKLASGNPLAMAYAGHQFGGFAPVLGDGRALLIGEIRDPNGNLFDIHLKGSGRTPFTRGGDGKAALGPVLREYLISEAMHALGIPTTRALAAVVTGEKVYREQILPGAVLARAASSHLRVGTFQFFAARREIDKLRRLADYAIGRHYPSLENEPEKYLQFLRAVIDRQANLVSKWMLNGFVHGVMNTDNTTISGETIDYGPCAFMDSYSRHTVFSSIDTMGRYAFGSQPNIAQWNMARLAECLLVLINEEDPDNATQLATAELDNFQAIYENYWLDGMRLKLGLSSSDKGDLDLINGLYSTLEGQGIDFTQFFRELSNRLVDGNDNLYDAHGNSAVLQEWLLKWQLRSQVETTDLNSRKKLMDAVNPIYIPRNHLVEEALNIAVESEDIKPFNRLLEAVSMPFAQRKGFENFELPAPSEFGPYRTFCGT